jgi:hypothetical protein
MVFGPDRGIGPMGIEPGMGVEPMGV